MDKPLRFTKLAKEFEATSSVVESMKALFENKNHGNFNLIVQGKAISVHKYVLAHSWPYFEYKFSSDCLNEATHTTRMPLNVFNALLEYFYTLNTAQLKFDECGWILSERQRYHLDDNAIGKHLIAECQSVIDANFNAHSWLDMLTNAVLWNNPQLQDRVIKSAEGKVETKHVLAVVQEQVRTYHKAKAKAKELKQEKVKNQEQIRQLLEQLNIK